MRRTLAVFSTDEVNRLHVKIPASALMDAHQQHVKDSVDNGTILGVPLHIQHDMHRLVGWARPIGIYLDGVMARLMGVTEWAETDDDKKQVADRAELHWATHRRNHEKSYLSELSARVSADALESASFFIREGAMLKRDGLAAELYPEFFSFESDLVDKDGLVDYRELCRRLKQVQPGVFCDESRGLLLFAHRFFRRNFSHKNTLNGYFLKRLADVSEQKTDLRIRVKLDPDIVGHSDSARMFFELEYWHGPHYDDDISKIPNGVTEHKASDRSRFFESIDRTQFWWKGIESRLDDQNARCDYRTFEMEELVDDSGAGLEHNSFGCRYAHAEFSVHSKSITHFDGAIRVYGSDAYLKRIDQSIDRAGKNASYTKLFRLDGLLSISIWKQLLSDFFRGNPLVPEYLGVAASENDQAVSISMSDLTPNDQHPSPTLSLAAMINVGKNASGAKAEINADHLQQVGTQIIPFLEVGNGKIADAINELFDLRDAPRIEFKDATINLSRIYLGASLTESSTISVVMRSLALALRNDVSAGLLRHAAIPLSWETDGLLITLSIAGEAEKVAELLDNLPTVIDPTKLPSEWIDALSSAITMTAKPPQSLVRWCDVNRDILYIDRVGVFKAHIKAPDGFLSSLLSLSSAGSANVSE